MARVQIIVRKVGRLGAASMSIVYNPIVYSRIVDADILELKPRSGYWNVLKIRLHHSSDKYDYPLNDTYETYMTYMCEVITPDEIRGGP